MRSDFADACRTLSGLIESLSGLAPVMEETARVIADAVRSGHKILFCGNGGSAADAQHLAAELVVRLRPGSDRRALPGIALTTDSSVLTACANDFGFSTVFSRQIEALGNPGDVLVALSTSGQSENVLRALESAGFSGLRTVFLTGSDGSPVGADYILEVPSADCNRVQEAHVFLGHQLIGMAESLL